LLTPDSPNASEWLSQVVEAERRGELLTAFDLAERGLAEHPRDVRLRHRAVLELARAGSTEQARARFAEYALADVDDEDVRALEARIAKDVALAAEGAERRRLALRSASLYEAVFDDTRGYYPGVNAATLRLVAGDREGSVRLARAVLAVLQAGGDDGYYARATEAEAELLLGGVATAATAVERAAALHGGDFAAVATTRRQLRLVCELNELDDSVLAPLAGPRVVHYCGHRAVPGSPAEGALAEAIAAEVARARPAYAYGSLASGADILWAEALLSAGCDLHVALPFARDEFVATSVADAGPEWVDRFEACLAAATEVSQTTDGPFLGDDVLFRYCAEFAMGLALLRARFLDSEAVQLAVWDGATARGAAGTAVDVATWRRHGRETHVVSPGGRPPAVEAPVASAAGRAVHALLFADVKGFSRLDDGQLPRFAEHVLGAFAAVLDAHGPSVLFRNTWGDGVYAVLTDVVAAAACALDLQAAMASLDLAAHGLPPDLGLRLGGHVGPVIPVHDPVLDATAFMGSHVSRTARVEPVTPPGVVYVTESFAAALELSDSGHVADYVGHMPAAKDFGRLRMYRLAERRGGVRPPRRAPSRRPS
jgi:Adenylate and Guanylate cyclase catalytic domain